MLPCHHWFAHCCCKRAGATARCLCRPQTAPPRHAPHLIQGLRGPLVFAATSPQHRRWRRQSANLISMFGYNHHLLYFYRCPTIIKCQPCSVHRRRFLHCFEGAVPVFIGVADMNLSPRSTLAAHKTYEKNAPPANRPPPYPMIHTSLQ